MFSDEVVMHLNVLFPSVKDKVSSKMDTTEIVVVEQDWIVDGGTQILKYPLKPYCFSRPHHIAPLSREKKNPEVDCLSTL